MNDGHGVERYPTVLTSMPAAQDASPELRSLVLRASVTDGPVDLKLPFDGLQLPDSCTVALIGALVRVKFDTSICAGGDCSERAVAAACVKALQDALLGCGARSLSLELRYNHPVYCELGAGRSGGAREIVTVHQLRVALMECGLAAGSPVRVTCTEATDGLRAVIMRRCIPL